MKVGVIGASGYSGEVLLQLLARHPQISEVVAASRSLAGKLIDEVMPSLRGALSGCHFIASDLEVLLKQEVETWFLALPHGVSAEFALPLVEARKTVIDLSADFRLFDKETYAEYYGQPHPAPEWLEKVPYVIPELADPSWKNASLIAVPGCYPTSVLVPLVPLLKKGLIDSDNIVINSVSGVSGAGKKSDNLYSYCERNESVKAYGMAKHRHLAEIEEQLSFAQGKPLTVQFTPHLVPMNRGIATTIVVKSNLDLKVIYECWEATYGKSSFIHVLKSGDSPDTAKIVGTNRVDLSAVKDARTQNLVITSAEDNLMKGASGQAIQILNLKNGFAEKAGLL